MKNILAFRLTRHVLSAAMGVGMLAVLIMGNMGTALADSPNVDLTVDSGGQTVSTGSLTLTDPAHTPSTDITSSGFIMDGKDHTISITLPITATDASGSGLGWNVTIAAGPVITSGDTSHTLHNMPAVTGVVVSHNSSQSSETDPTNDSSVTSTFPRTLSSSPAPVFSAAADPGNHAGMGQFLLTTTATLKVRADDYIPDTGDSYATTLTVAINSGP